MGSSRLHVRATLLPNGSRPRHLQPRSSPGTASDSTAFLHHHVRRVMLIHKTMAAVLRLNFGSAMPTRLLLMALDFLGGDDHQNTYIGKL